MDNYLVHKYTRAHLDARLSYFIYLMIIKGMTRSNKAADKTEMPGIRFGMHNQLRFLCFR